jgi:uncharacterized protein YrrD
MGVAMNWRLKMIKGSQLIGRSVVDMEAAERLGKIKEIIVQRDGERVAGFVVAHGETFIGTGGTRRIIPASALHAIGPDAVTVRASVIKDRPPEELDTMPRMSDVIGHKMVTRSGRLLGSIDDVLINGADGSIIGFSVGEGMRNKVESILNPDRSRIHGYVRADADLQVGNELIVVPDDALIEGEPAASQSEAKPAESTQEEMPRGWGDRDDRKSTRRSIWTRRIEASKAAAPQAPEEARRESANVSTAESGNVAAEIEHRREASCASDATEVVTPQTG